MKTQMVDGKPILSDNTIRSGIRIHGIGTITKTFNDKPVISMCEGCRDDFYNDHNHLGVKRCWGFKTAHVVNKVGYSTLHVMNGPDTKMTKTLSCWHAVRK